MLFYRAEALMHVADITSFDVLAQRFNVHIQQFADCAWRKCGALAEGIRDWGRHFARHQFSPFSA